MFGMTFTPMRMFPVFREMAAVVGPSLVLENPATQGEPSQTGITAGDVGFGNKTAESRECFTFA